jgi:peptide chain release factor subunit 1
MPAATVRKPAPADAEGVPRAESIDRIARFHGGELPVVSMYVAVSPGPDSRQVLRTKVDSLLHEIRPLAGDRSLPHDTRMSLRGDIERIEAAVNHEVFPPGTIAMFGCSGGGLFEEVSLPRALRDRIVVDATPWIRPLLAVLDEYQRALVAVVERGSAHVSELYLGRVRDAGRLDAKKLRKPAYAGWQGLDEHRVRNKADELSKRYFRALAAALDQEFRTDRYDLLVLGGHRHELPELVEQLPRALRSRVAGTFTVDADTATRGDIRRQAEEVLDRFELERQRSEVEEVLERAAAGGLAGVGLEACLWAGSVAAIDTLYVQDGAVSPGVVCDESGWFATAGERCPICGAELRRTPDVIDELVEAVIGEGGSIRHVRAETELRDRVAAAALRFALPPAPDA